MFLSNIWFGEVSADSTFYLLGLNIISVRMNNERALQWFVHSGKDAHREVMASQRSNPHKAEQERRNEIQTEQRFPQRSVTEVPKRNRKPTLIKKKNNLPG